MLDTHVFLWSVTDSDKLSQDARDRIVAAEEVYVSAASVWEVAIKARVGKIAGNLEELAGTIESSGFLELPVLARHAAGVATLPDHHNDPFDRLLVAQAMAEPLLLLTADRVLARYTDLVRVI